MGGLASSSLRRFSGLSNPMPEERASAWTCTLPSALPVMETSPEVLLSSRRIGPLTLSVRSKLPLADGPIAQPALATVANNKHASPADLRSVIVPPCEYRTKPNLPRLPSKRRLKEDTEICGIMFRTAGALKCVSAVRATHSVSLVDSLQGRAPRR